MTITVGRGYTERAERVAAVAAAHADDVDAKGRFPREAVDAMIAERLLSIQIPAALGGEEASLSEIAETCSLVGQSCAAAAMARRKGYCDGEVRVHLAGGQLRIRVEDDFRVHMRGAVQRIGEMRLHAECLR